VFGILKGFEFAVDCEEFAEVGKGGFFDFIDEGSEETLDREEEVVDCVLGLDTGGLLLQHGGKLGGFVEFDVADVEEECEGFVVAVLEVLLLLLPDEALTVESCS
jgi:hypothetical protein